MKRSTIKKSFSRLLSLLLIVTVAVTFIPAFADSVHAAEAPDYAVSAPINSASQYTAYSNYFDYSYSNGGYYIPMGYSLYMEYRSGNGAWITSGQMNNPYLLYKFSNLASRSYYQTRTYFGRWYGDTFYKGPYSNTVTVKTGTPKLNIRKIQVKAVKVRKHRGTAWWYFWKIGKYKYYSYKVKVTVTLKKKPGAKGIYINGKRVKGNKRKYTATFGPYTNYSKPKGKKFIVYAYSYQNPTYGGYSNLYRKTLRVR